MGVEALAACLPQAGPPRHTGPVSFVKLATCRPVTLGGSGGGLGSHRGGIFMSPAGPMGVFVKKNLSTSSALHYKANSGCLPNVSLTNSKSHVVLKKHSHPIKFHVTYCHL